MFGDIVKVTPSSKVVGDMALAMVSAGLTRADVEDPKRDIAFPDSVVGFFAGDLGQPPGGFPKALQKKVLKGKTPLTERPGSYLKDVDLEAERKKIAEEVGRRDRRLPPRLVPDVSQGLSRTSRRPRTATARPKCCRRRSISTA